MSRLVAVAALQSVFVSQLKADGFFFFVQGHGLLQPPPRVEDQRLVAVAGLQTVLVAQLQADGFLFLE